MWYWVICTLNDEATKIIIFDTLMHQEKFKIKNRNMEVCILQKKYQEVSDKKLMEHFYAVSDEKYFQIHFLTPTAFKQKGKYVFYPDLHCIFQSLMKKYDTAVKENTMVDEETLEQLCENAQIVKYDLKSVNFFLESVRIPAFIGKITIKMNGTQTMANFAKMLFEFGTYSGVGIKTSIGMGCIKLLERRER